MLRKTVLILAFHLIVAIAYAQSPYQLKLKAERWNISPDEYFISEVIDQRDKKDDAGQVLVNGKSTRAVFNTKLESDLLTLINNSMVQDTSKVALSLGVEKLILKETGTVSSHKATLEFTFKIFRISEGKSSLLFEVSGRPELSMKGNYPEPHEKNINAALKNAMESFNKWVEENSNIPPLAKSVIIILDTDKRFRKNSDNDTIQWNENEKLSWDDFKGKPSSSPFMAQSNCLFSYKAEPQVKNGIMELHINLLACFEKNGSWVKSGQKKDILLAHEQLHFDICELNIRRLRQKMLDQTFTPMKFEEQVKLLFDEAWKNYQLEQDKYDSETEHGTVSDSQLSWEKNVQKLLIETSNLKNSSE